MIIFDNMKVRLTERDKIHIKDSNDIYIIMQKVLLRENKFSRRRERFWMMGLDAKHRLKYVELLALGKYNVVNIEPIEIFHLAVLKQCASIVLIHNHPGGDLTPSKNDGEVTEYLYAAARVLKIHLVDHLIISETDYYSFLKNGKMNFK